MLGSACGFPLLPVLLLLHRKRYIACFFFIPSCFLSFAVSSHESTKATGVMIDHVVARSRCIVTLPHSVNSQSWMVSPGLLGSGPIQAAIDMLGAAKQRVTASDVLTGLMQRPGTEGPALAADFFAALIAAAAAAAESGRAEGGDHGLSGLRSRVSMASSRDCVHCLFFL